MARNSFDIIRALKCWCSELEADIAQLIATRHFPDRSTMAFLAPSPGSGCPSCTVIQLDQ